MSAAAIHDRGMIHSTFYHLNTLYLFTSDQFLDMVFPSTVFMLAAISGSVLSLLPQNPLRILQQLPTVWFWLWLIILKFCLHNQRHTEFIEEDAINKPWRPIPAKRVTQEQAKWLLVGTHVVSGFVSWHLGVLPFSQHGRFWLGGTMTLVAETSAVSRAMCSVARSSFAPLVEHCPWLLDRTVCVSLLGTGRSSLPWYHYHDYLDPGLP